MRSILTPFNLPLTNSIPDIFHRWPRNYKVDRFRRSLVRLLMKPLSTQTTWCLFELAQRPDIQSKLREELLSVPTEAPTMEELNALEILKLN